MDVAKFVICGLEHSGTTLVSELVRQVPGVDAGFEIGVLLNESPRDFPSNYPFADLMLPSWGLSYETLLCCCDTDDFQEFYKRLQASSSMLRLNTHTIYDKTPRYLASLNACMQRLAVPFIITFKDPRSTVYSDFKSSGATDFDVWFESYAPEKLGYMRLHYQQFEQARNCSPARACFVRLEDLCLYPHLTCSRFFHHVGFRFDLAYLSFRPARYQNTRVGSIATGLPFEYRNGLGPWRSRKVGLVFHEFAAWFFE